tara:strand:- start:46 stop:858 length:813 start_codon:yes stop_codon:yes gene_type:complete
MSLKVQVIGGPFLHSMSTTLNKKSNLIEWTLEYSDIKMFVDQGIQHGVGLDKTNHYAFISETKAINSDIYEWCLREVDLLKNSFTYVFTHYDELLKLGEPFKFAPLTGTWINEIELKPKTKTISAIASSKSWLPGHKLRLNFLKDLPEHVDMFGRDTNPINTKEEGLEDYMFSIAIENDVYDDYFTEKILDCFATGTVPIYYGTKSISKYFNPMGILRFETKQELTNLIWKLDEKLYNSMQPAIKDNLDRVRMYDMSETHIGRHLNEKSS